MSASAVSCSMTPPSIGCCSETRLSSWPYQTVIPPYSQTGVRLAELQSETLIVYPKAPRPSYADQVLGLFRTHGIKPARLYEVRELQTALGLVAAEVGICIVPRRACSGFGATASGMSCSRRSARVSPILMSTRKNDTSPELELLVGHHPGDLPRKRDYVWRNERCGKDSANFQLANPDLLPQASSQRSWEERRDGTREADAGPRHPAARAVPDRLLLHRLSGPRQRRLRGPDHGTRISASPNPPSASAPASLLLHLLPLRGPLEPVPRQVRRPPLDRPHHDHLGHPFRRDGLHPRRMELLRRPLPARRRRSRLLPRHHLLSDPLVSRLLPRPHSRLFHGRNPALLRAWPARLRRAARHGGRRRHAWLAVAVHHRGGPGPHSLRSSSCNTLPTSPPTLLGWRPTAATGSCAALPPKSQVRTTAQPFSVGQALVNGRVLALSLVYFGVVASLYGLSFFLRRSSSSSASPRRENALISAIPYVVGTIATLVWGRLSDRTGNARDWSRSPCSSSPSASPPPRCWTTRCSRCAPSASPPSVSSAPWPCSGRCRPPYISGMAAAGGIAVINSIGNLAGFAGPYAMGAIKDATNSYQGGLFLLAGAGGDRHVHRARLAP